MPKKLIGRQDIIDFPDLQLEDIDVKIDTGADTSALHCHCIKKIIKEDKKYVSFQVLDPKHPAYEKNVYTFPLHKTASIKSSNGQTEERYIIKTSAVIFGETYSINLSLTDRSKMKFPILIGRKFLKGKFIVDVEEKNLSHKEKEALEL
jgi:hypothetical protein